jgi:AcrR family transcriptional regulator
MFREQGYHAVTMEDLAQRAGVSRPSVYSYFHSKRAIFMAIAIAVNSRYQEAVRQFTTIERSPSLGTHVSSWVSEYLAFLEETSWVTTMWDEVVSADDRLRQEGVRQHTIAWRRFGTHMATLRGAKSTHDPIADGMMSLSMLERVWFYWSLAGSPFSRSRLVKEVTSALQAVIDRP